MNEETVIKTDQKKRFISNPQRYKNSFFPQRPSLRNRDPSKAVFIVVDFKHFHDL